MEEWRPIEGFPNYAVSDAGRVARVFNGTGKFSSRGRGGRILKPYHAKVGYYVVNLCQNGSPVLRKIHRLVAMAFLPRDPKRTHVNHVNGDKLDNRLSNLEWCTHRENLAHASATGLIAFGARLPHTKFSSDVVAAVLRDRAHTGDTLKQIAMRHGMSRANAGLICQGKTRVREIH